MKEHLVKLAKFLLLIIIVTSNLYSFALKDNSVETIAWNNGKTLLGFLEANTLPLKLYYGLDDEAKKFASQIMEGATTYITKDSEGDIYQALIPINEELQIHISKNCAGAYILRIEPIKYKTEKKTVLIKLNSVFSKDIVDKTKNPPLAFKLQHLFKHDINFKHLKKGDKVGVIYIEKTRMNKRFGSQKILAAFIEHRGRRKYKFLYNERYYDQKAKVEREVSSFVRPCKFRRISSTFSKKRWHPILKRYRAHHGIDYANRTGTPIYATYSGKVIFVGRKGGYGKSIVIRHPNGYQSLYAHLHSYSKGMKRGKRVKRGQLIAKMGSTGLSTGPHLHFGIKYRGRWINPARKIVIVENSGAKLRKKILKNVRRYKPVLDKLK